MKNALVKLLSALLLAALLLSPAALMEDAAPDALSDFDEPVSPEAVDPDLPEELTVELAEDALDLVEDDEAAQALFGSGTLIPELQALEIESSYFPDPAFQAYLKTLPGGEDGKLTLAERDNISGIDVHSEALTDLSGIEFFRYLRALHFNGCSVTSIDLSGNAELTSLDCSNTSLTELDVSHNPNLALLYCWGCAISALDVSDHAALQYLRCYNSGMKSLNVSGCTALEILDCSENALEALKLTGHDSLEVLCCDHNSIPVLELWRTPKLVPIVNDAYKRWEIGGYTVYSESLDEYNNPEGVRIRCDLATKLILSEPTPEPTPAPTPEPTSVPAPTPAPVPVISALKSKNSATVYVGTVYQIDLGGKKAKSYKSSKKKVASVSKAGLLTPKKAGKAKITIKIGKKKRALTLKVVDPTIPTSITLNLSGTVAAKVGVPQALSVTLPEGTTSGIKWKSSNKKVASVKNGVVTFKKKGKVTITLQPRAAGRRPRSSSRFPIDGMYGKGPPNRLGGPSLSPVRVDHLLDVLLRVRADDPVHQLAVLEQHQRGNAGDAQPDGHVGVLIHVDLGEGDVGRLRGQLLHDGGHHAAGAAPGRPEIHQRQPLQLIRLHILSGKDLDEFRHIHFLPVAFIGS